MTDVTPRSDEAERIVLGALMLHPTVADDVWSQIGVGDFYLPRHQTIAATIRRAHSEGKPTDPVAVLTELRAAGVPQLGELAPYLHTLIASVPSAANAGYYAAEIRACSDRRHLIEQGTRLVQAAENPVNQPGATAREYAAVLADMGEADLIAGSQVHVPSLDEFLTGDEDDMDWVIPGLLDRDDRVLLTGHEGLGKIVCLQQIAVMAAAGLHPFTGSRIRPVKAHILDLENPHRIMRKNLRRLQLLADSDGSPGATQRVFVDRRPDGLDLSKPGDLGWLLRRLQHTDPDVLVIGPLYKLTASDPSEERPARLLAEALDMIRTRVGCALLIEHHAGHGSGHLVRPVRPTGSSVWLRWPEFGMGLRLAQGDDSARLRRLDVVPWRGGRDDREWPRRLIAGPRWPFMVEDTYEVGAA